MSTIHFDKKAIEVPGLLDWSSLDAQSQLEVLQRPPLPQGDLQEAVAEIIRQVGEKGDEAVYDYTRKFDQLQLEQLEVSEAEWRAGESQVTEAVSEAINDAISRIEAFHTAGKPVGLTLDTAVGVHCEARYLPIESVGLYVPGGTAPLISTVMMLAVPARIAGCRSVVMCTPANDQGEVAPAILLAASRSGVKRIFKVGGAQAIAAMGLGTETIPACAKLAATPTPPA